MAGIEARLNADLAQTRQDLTEALKQVEWLRRQEKYILSLLASAATVDGKPFDPKPATPETKQPMLQTVPPSLGQILTSVIQKVGRPLKAPEAIDYAVQFGYLPTTVDRSSLIGNISSMVSREEKKSAPRWVRTGRGLYSIGNQDAGDTEAA